MSNQILLDPSQFFTQMVDKAFQERKIKALPSVKSYLVKLLHHFMDSRNLYNEAQSQQVHESYPSHSSHSSSYRGGIESEMGPILVHQKKQKTFAENFLLAQNAQGEIRKTLLKNIGDKTLYICGFFGDSLNRKLVDVDYYADIGVSSYSILAKSFSGPHLDQKVFSIFAKKFLTIVDVLSYMSSQLMLKEDQNILRTYEIYLKTGSEFAREQLHQLGITPQTHSLFPKRYFPQ